MSSSAKAVQELDSVAKDEVFYLCPVEIETLRRAAAHRGMSFDPEQLRYSSSDLRRYGLVREGYNRQELRERGVESQVVSSLDTETALLMQRLPLETPFGEAIQKYELPIDMLPLRVAKTIFLPGSHVKSHTHPPHSVEAPGGGLRIIASGSIEFENRKYSAGDWFFVPNGRAYEFVTDPHIETIVFYSYAFFGLEDGNRFSHPFAAE
jgi:hypothetical protein